MIRNDRISGPVVLYDEPRSMAAMIACGVRSIERTMVQPWNRSSPCSGLPWQSSLAIAGSRRSAWSSQSSHISADSPRPMRWQIVLNTSIPASPVSGSTSRRTLIPIQCGCASHTEPPCLRTASMTCCGGIRSASRSAVML